MAPLVAILIALALVSFIYICLNWDPFPAPPKRQGQRPARP